MFKMAFMVDTIFQESKKHSQQEEYYDSWVIPMNQAYVLIPIPRSYLIHAENQREGRERERSNKKITTNHNLVKSLRIFLSIFYKKVKIIIKSP